MLIASNLTFGNIFLSCFINTLRLFKRLHSGANLAQWAPGPRVKDGCPNLKGAELWGYQGQQGDVSSATWAVPSWGVIKQIPGQRRLELPHPPGRGMQWEVPADPDFTVRLYYFLIHMCEHC